MSVTTSFSTKGRRNGLNFCPTKVDVSSYGSWVTLGGFSDTSTGDPDIEASRIAAMKLFWNAESITGSASDSQTYGDTGDTASVSSTSVNVGDNNSPPDSNDKTAPKDRVCLSQLGGENDDSATDGSAIAQIDLRNQIILVAMYDGATTDPDNFVGYGIDSLVDTDGIYFSAGDVTEPTFAFVGLVSFTDTTSSTVNNNKVSVDKVTVSGIHFVCVAECNAPTNGTVGSTTHLYTTSASAIALSASASGTSSFDDGTDSYVDTFSSSASLTSIDFYTYS